MTTTTSQLANIILKAADIHEGSWDTELRYYMISHSIATVMANDDVRDHNTELASLLLKDHWNAALEWAVKEMKVEVVKS